MGAANEYDPMFLDSVLVHAGLIPVIGRELQGYLDNLACPRGSDNLLSLCTSATSKLAEVGEIMIKSMMVLHKDREFPERPDMVAILVDLENHLKKSAVKQGYETLRELVLRLVERLGYAIFWNEYHNQDLIFSGSGKDRAPRLKQGSGKGLSSSSGLAPRANRGK